MDSDNEDRRPLPQPPKSAPVPELDFPEFFIESERAMVAPYIGKEHAQYATPIELLNFHASRVLLQRLKQMEQRKELDSIEQFEGKFTEDIIIECQELVLSKGMTHIARRDFPPNFRTIKLGTQLFNNRLVHMVAVGELTVIYLDRVGETTFKAGTQLEINEEWDHEIFVGHEGCTIIFGGIHGAPQLFH